MTTAEDHIITETAFWCHSTSFFSLIKNPIKIMPNMCLMSYNMVKMYQSVALDLALYAVWTQFVYSKISG